MTCATCGDNHSTVLGCFRGCKRASASAANRAWLLIALSACAEYKVPGALGVLSALRKNPINGTPSSANKDAYGRAFEFYEAVALDRKKQCAAVASLPGDQIQDALNAIAAQHMQKVQVAPAPAP